MIKIENPFIKSLQFTLKKLLIISVIISILLFGFYFKNTQREKKIRPQPLTYPLYVKHIIKDGLVLDDGKLYKLAGVEFPKMPSLLKETKKILQILTKQGIEVRREVSKGVYLLRCEPITIMHPCRNGAPSTIYYKQVSLNELLIISGYAKLKKNTNFTEEEEILFVACEMTLKIYRGSSSSFFYGIESDGENLVRPTKGLRIFNVLSEELAKLLIKKKIFQWMKVLKKQSKFLIKQD